MTNYALPKPTGYRMLVKPLQDAKRSAGGIILADESQKYADVACFVGQVMAQGDECYSGRDDRFSNGPWCQVGDWVAYARHVGQTVKMKNSSNPEDDDEYMIINDEDVRAVVPDPSQIRMYL